MYKNATFGENIKNKYFQKRWIFYDKKNKDNQ